MNIEFLPPLTHYYNVTVPKLDRLIGITTIFVKPGLQFAVSVTTAGLKCLEAQDDLPVPGPFPINPILPRRSLKCFHEFFAQTGLASDGFGERYHRARHPRILYPFKTPLRSECIGLSLVLLVAVLNTSFR